ncbi:hypothetical protein M5K25_016469 [Dendrobium thyrsiflorum]|uniref:RAVE complex protein Rav1 C-terminal domain-containing protein n=1 Tax=Dendrobium thyrsiflorum TaxID=117978 RepID=A0ABD0UJT1_DENTH
MIDEAVSLLGSGGASASAASVEAEDVSTLLPLSLRRSQLIPPAPNRRRSAIDFLHGFGGSSWIAYGASSLLVISHFPSPLPEHENLVGPFFRQVIEPSSCSAVNWAADVNAVSWCPVCPSEGEVAAAQGNSIWLYAPQPDNDTGSFCWSQTAGVMHSSIVEAIEWTGSGDGLIAAGMEVVFWRRKGSSWEMSWKSAADFPQAMVSATWSAGGPVATAACYLTSVEIGAQNLPDLAKVDCRLVSVYHSDGKSEVIKIQLCHPQPVSLIRWRPSTLMKLTKDALRSWRDVLLTCCLDGTVRLWSEIDDGKSRKVSKEIDHKIRQPFQVVAVIEIEQCLNGTLGTTIFIDWAVDMAGVISKSEGDCHSLSSASSKHDHIASCEWLISVGPVNLVALWAVHCLDDAATFRSPRVTLWWKKNPVDLQAFNFSNYQSLRPAEKPVLVKVVAMRRQLFGPPFACSLLQLFPDNCMTWWHFYSPSIDDAEHNSLTQVSKERCLSHFTAGVLNIDGHSANILQLALHPCSHELELAVSLDSNGFLLFWSFSKHFNCTLGMQMYIHPTWKLMGKIRSQDLSTDLQYLTVGWVPFVLDEKPLLLLGYTGGIDCFLIKVPGEGEDILCHKIFSVSFASHNYLEGSPDLIFATPLAYFSKSLLLCGVWMKALRTLSWKIVLQSEDLTGSSCEFSSDSETVLMPGNTSKWISCSGRRYSVAICPTSWNFPHAQNSKTMICVSVVTLDHSMISNVNIVISDNGSYDNSISLMAIGFSDGVLELWNVSSAKSFESECIPWVLVGKFAAHDGPVNAVSLSSCGSKIATVSVDDKNCMTTLHIWTPICLIGGGSFILEDVLLFNGPVIALKWSVIGNGNLLLGVCMTNEFHIYCERRSHNKSKELHPWCCISMSHSCHPCHEFQWGPKLIPVLLHEGKISIFSEWLSETEYKHIGESSSIYTISTDENSRCGISLKNNVHGANELSQLDNKENGIAFNVLSSGSFLKKEKCDTRNTLHNLMDMVERLCRPLESYHPWALLQYLYSGNWKRAYIVLKHLVDSLSPLDASTTVVERCSSEKPCHIPQISLSRYLDGTPPEEPGSNTVQWGEGSTFVSATFEKNVFQFGKDTLKPTIYNDIPVLNGLKSEIMRFIDTLEKSPTLAALTNMERIHILTVLDILLELSDTSYASLYDSLDEPGRRFWVAVRFQHFQFLRKVGRVAAREEFAIESWLIAWACQSDCQENLLNSILSTEPSWLEMRNLGLGYWFTNASQLRARVRMGLSWLALRCSFELIDPHHVIIRLSSKVDYTNLFSQLSYYICGFSMHMLKWSPRFDSSEEALITPRLTLWWIGCFKFCLLDETRHELEEIYILNRLKYLIVISTFKFYKDTPTIVANNPAVLYYLFFLRLLLLQMEKLARLQYLKRKNPKDCALLYLALNRLHVLAGLFRISKDEKDKILFGFLSRNFQEEKNKAAALKNAYVLMGRHQLELAVAFFLLGGDPSSAVTVCAKNLGDEQLALVICRLLEGYGGPLEKQLISSILLPNAIDKKDYWLSSVFEWSLGNYSESVKRLFEPSVHCSNHVAARKCCHVSFADPHIGRYCLILASKPCLKNAIGDYLASVLSKFSTVMDSYSLKRFGLPLEALERFASHTTEGNSEVNTKHIEAIFEGQPFPFSTATATQAWLQEGFAYHLESNFRLSLAMKFISNLLRELPCWAYRNPVIIPELVKHDDSESDQDKHQTGEFRQKLNVVILTFERRYSLKLIDLANMVLLLACNNGLLFLGYQLLQGFIFREHDVDNQHKTGHSTRCTILFSLIVKANKELFYAYSRYVVCCHLSDSTLKLLSGRASTVENCSESYFQRNFCMQSLICSLRIIKPLVKYYDNLLLSEGLALSTYSFLELVEYMMYFSRNWFSRNISGLIQMVCQIHSAFANNHDSIEVMTGERLKILHPTSDNNTSDASNDDAEVLHEFINKKNQAKLRNSLAFSIPEDERWQLIGTSLWIHNNSFANQQLSKFLATEKLEAEKSIADHNQFRIAVAKLTMASIAYVSSSLTKQLASFLREKTSKGLTVATFAWLEESNQHESSSLPHQSDQGVCIRQLSASEDREALAKKLWEISINAKEIYQNLLNEKVYGFTYSREKLPSSWKDFQEANLSEHVSGASHYKSEGNSSARNAVGSLFGKKILDTDSFLETTRRDSGPKLEKANFCIPTEIVKRSGELLEGLFFFDWKMEPAYKEKSLLIWPEVDWPLDGWACSESKPGPTCVSPGVELGSKSGTHLGLGGATVGLDSTARPVRDLTGGGAFGIPGYAGIGASGLGWGEQIEFEFLNPPAVAEHVCSRALSSHPSRPFLLVGSINTLIYLWEFGKDRATATYGVLPAVNVPPPYALASISALEFDHSGHRFATAALDGTVCTWQLEVGGRSNVHPTESSLCFNNHASDVAYVVASGSILAAAGCSTNGHNVVLWDTLAPPGTSQASLFCHEGGARSLSVFDNDVGTGSISPLIVTGGKNGDVGLHDFRYIATGRSKRHRQPRDQDFKSATFLNTSNHVDNANGMIWYIPKAHLGSITKITTIPNTSMFLTGSKDGDVKLWDAKRAQLVFHWQRIHDRHTFIQPNSRTIGGVVRAAVTDIQVFSSGFLTCGGDGSVKLKAALRSSKKAVPNEAFEFLSNHVGELLRP